MVESKEIGVYIKENTYNIIWYLGEGIPVATKKLYKFVFTSVNSLWDAFNYFRYYIYQSKISIGIFFIVSIPFLKFCISSPVIAIFSYRLLQQINCNFKVLYQLQLLLICLLIFIIYQALYIKHDTTILPRMVATNHVN